MEGTDYEVDYTYGAITFLTAQATAPSVNYGYAGSVNTTLFTQKPIDLFLRFEGINLAEGGAAKILELYKISFSPAAALALIQGIPHWPVWRQPPRYSMTPPVLMTPRLVALAASSMLRSQSHE